MSNRSTLLARTLTASGRLSMDLLRRAEVHRQVQGGELDTAVLELGLLSEEEILQALAEATGCPSAGAGDLETIPPEILRLVPQKVALRHRAIAFRSSGPAAAIAVLDPTDLRLQDELAFVAGRRVRLHVASELRLERALARHFSQTLSPRLRELATRLGRPQVTVEEGWEEPEFDLGGAEPDFAVPRPSALGTTPGAPTPGSEASDPSLLARGTASRESAMTGAGTATTQVAGAPILAAVAPVRPTAVPLSEAERHRLAVAATAAPVAAKGTEPQPVENPSPDPGASSARSLQREAIAQKLLDQARESVDRVVLFRIRDRRAEGWGARGRVDLAKVSGLRIDLQSPSFLSSLQQGARFFLGPLAPLKSNLDLAEAWDGTLPTASLAVPLTVRGRLTAVLYADRSGRSFSSEDLDRMNQLAANAARALEALVLETKTSGKSKKS